MICPKCLTIETEGSLKCRKCGAQLYTGVFQRPVADPPEGRPSRASENPPSSRAKVIAVAVFALSVLGLLLLLSQLERLSQ